MDTESERLRSMTMMNRLSCLSVAALLVVLAMPAWAQSFNCKKAFFADERTICEEPRLGRLDSELATLFGHVISRLPRPQQAALKREETGWVVARRRCGDDRRCIAGSYGRRMQKLDAMLAANEREGIGLQPRQRAEGKREPPAIGSSEISTNSGSEASITPISGSAAPMPKNAFDVDPEVPAAGQNNGGGMTPER
jgi:uncharacterized protein